MSRDEIVSVIERLRARMHDMFNAGADYDELLIASRELDKFIVMYHKAAW